MSSQAPGLSEERGTSKEDDDSLSDLEELPDDDEVGMGTSEQEKKAADDLAHMKQKQNEEFRNKLDHIRKNTKLWESKDNQYLREFCNEIECNREEFPCMPGDRCYKAAVDQGEEHKKLTKGYIAAIAAHDDTFFVLHPVLYVHSRETTHEAQTFEGFCNSDSTPPKVKVTHLRLVDGDGNQMLGRLATEIADQGKQLRKQGGDVIRLDRYTEMTHRINNKTARMPYVFIHKYTQTKFCRKPPVDKVHDPLPYTTAPPSKPPPAKKSKTADVSDAPVTDCQSKRYCTIHGVYFPVCICETIKVKDLDLPSIKEDYYFATDELDKMSNSHKRNMIYWWYATNVYSICGKGKRKELPKCLVHEIRRKYPSKEYCGFELHCGMHNDN